METQKIDRYRQNERESEAQKANKEQNYNTEKRLIPFFHKPTTRKHKREPKKRRIVEMKLLTNSKVI